MAKLSFDDSDGVWRTVGGRKIFIRTGESLSSAMKNSGKFKSAKKKDYNVKEGNPIKDLADDRTKEKENTLANDKAMLEAMQRKGINEVNGWKKEDFENRIKKNEEYLKNTKGSKEFTSEDKKENDEQNSKKTGEVKDMIEVKDGTYLPIREGETKEDVMKAYNERQKKYRASLEPEVSKNLMDPRRLWDQDLVDTYIEMNEKGMFTGKDKDKFTRDMKNMEGKPLYSPDRIKGELNSESKENNSNKILNKNDLSKMSWEQVVQANTKYYSDKSIYDFEGGKAGKYKYEDGWRDNGGAGVIKQSDLDRLISKKEWEEAQKQTSNYMNDKVRRKAYQKYLKEHPASEITFNDFKDMMNYKK